MWRLYRKAQQRLHLLWKVRTFNISKNNFTLADISLIESIRIYNISTWFNFLTIKHKTKLSQIINQASKITQTARPSLCELHIHSVRKKATLFTEDDPSHHSFRLLPSGRRYRTPLARKKHLRKILYPLCTCSSASFPFDVSLFRGCHGESLFLSIT